MPSERDKASGFQFSLRSILLITCGVAVLCALYDSIPYDTVLAPVIVYFLAWIIPGASLGADMSSPRGMVRGGVIGAFLGGLLFLWLIQPVARE